ncbi:glycerophosphodiester phosphodiesterase [Sphaerospermopsis sp. LEGE 00249]|uniref:glycerophosphodiester phosphodiesterase n=1 Tax=Sphaerospermopsis sp. LEGE 00249 TaxID=1380707 RepID=UPI00164D8E3E|nr:glycerophosphodiester phosphodiesterase [Sphaerospermopsis sp. LEGE 00249]MBC5798345.1 glycerophosphodiester phosphodiesterase [Sphaerospermopsis sp. LEGE 00249]
MDNFRDSTFTNQLPIIIAHRGASGYRPEHTLAAYQLAIELGADYIEPDLVITKDGVLIARHENEISATTDIAEHPEFAHLRTTKIIDGEIITGWFTEDFTLAEIKTLRAQERIPQLRSFNTTYNGIYTIPTLEEIIDLAEKKSIEKNRKIGIYPETKHPTYFQSIDLELETPLLTALEKTHVPVFIQSFEVSNLKALAKKTNLPLVQLINDSGKPYDFVMSDNPRTYQHISKPAGLKKIAEYAQAIGVNKNLIIPRDSQGKLISPTSLVNHAHKENLLVHAWTFRNENYFLPLDCQDNPQEEYKLFFELGIDGVFSDFPDTASVIRCKNLIPRSQTS